VTRYQSRTILRYLESGAALRLKRRNLIGWPARREDSPEWGWHVIGASNNCGDLWTKKLDPTDCSCGEQSVPTMAKKVSLLVSSPSGRVLSFLDFYTPIFMVHVRIAVDSWRPLQRTNDDLTVTTY
jgi:hypothetical protein